MGHYQKMEEFQITNIKIFDVSDFLFSEIKYLYKLIDKSDKICNLKLKKLFYKFRWNEVMNQFMFLMLPSFENGKIKINKPLKILAPCICKVINKYAY